MTTEPPTVPMMLTARGPAASRKLATSCSSPRRERLILRHRGVDGRLERRLERLRIVLVALCGALFHGIGLEAIEHGLGERSGGLCGCLPDLLAQRCGPLRGGTPSRLR